RAEGRAVLERRQSQHQSATPAEDGERQRRQNHQSVTGSNRGLSGRSTRKRIRSVSDGSAWGWGPTRNKVKMRIDINSDMGESFGAYTIGHDTGLMKSIPSANVAAGFHAGDPSVLRDTIRLAKANGVAVGAHPGFPDLVGFGRRELNVTPREAEDFV